MWVRLCEQCGRPDLRERWDIAEDALMAHPVWAIPWRCPHCGGDKFAMTERDEPAPPDWLTGD